MALSAAVSSGFSLYSPSPRRRVPTGLFRISSRARRCRYLLSPACLGHVITADAVGEGFQEAVEELERMTRDPSDVLDAMVNRLSAREFQLVLVYFSQEGRDAYCALEVFDWLRRENRVDGETKELMVSIACNWIERLVDGDHCVGDVVGLLGEIECVGLEAEFSLQEKVVSLYWDRGKKEEAVEFVKDVMRRGAVGGGEGGLEEEERGGPLGYLAWKMMVDGKYMDAVKLVVELKEQELSPKVYSYVIALTALVKEQKDFTKSIRSLRVFIKNGLVSKLDKKSCDLLQKHQSDILEKGALLSRWALEEGSSAVSAVVHERLLALYTCAGCGLAAECQLWEMKLAGKELDQELYNMVLAICASQDEDDSIKRLLTGMEGKSARSKRKALLWMLRGYIKGGHYHKASEMLVKMLDFGICPGYMDRAAVLQGLGKSVKESGIPESYLKLCKRLSDMDLIGPCLLYLHLSRHKLWIIKAL